MAQCANDAPIDVHGAGRTFQRTTGCVCDVAALTNWWMNTELELLGHRDLDLGVLARGAENTDALDLPLRPDNRQLLFAGVLTRLREIDMFGELMSFTEQCFNMFLGEMNVVRRDFYEKWLLLLRL